MSEWQPIETAPRDGTVFFAFYPKSGVALCKWFVSKYSGNGYFYWEDGDTACCSSSLLTANGVSDPTHWMPLPEPPGASAEAPSSEAVALPSDVAELVLRIGRAEWGATDEKTAEAHAADLINSIALTDAHFGTEGPHQMNGLYIEGTGVVICHTGTSPNSPSIARALTGAWNRMHDEASALRALSGETA